MSISFETQLPQLASALNEIRAGMGQQVISTALGRAARNAYATARKELSVAGGWKAGYIKANSKLERPAQLEARITGRKKETNLIEFGARKTQRGVSSAPWRTRQIFPGTFIATGRGNNRLVFSRMGPKRFPLDPKWGPSLNRELIRENVVEPTVARFQRDVGPEIALYANFKMNTIFAKYGL